MLNVVMPSVIMLIVAMLNVIMLNVVAPNLRHYLLNLSQNPKVI
jgi:hypothetical protein